jgi:hypothetical protein
MFKQFHELEFEIDYDYQPEEEQRHDCPGSDEQITLNAVHLNGVDITAAVEADPNTLEIFQDSCVEDAHKNDVDRTGEREDNAYQIHKDNALDAVGV